MMNNIYKKFIHLRLHSAYSLSEGAIKLDTLVNLCEQFNMPAVAVTDTNNLFGVMDFSVKAAAHGIQPIIGCQLNVQHPKQTSDSTNVLLYAKNSAGYHNLINLVSSAYLHSSSDQRPEISLDFLSKYSKNLILLTGGIYGSFGKFLAENDIENAKEYLNFLKKHFDDRLYIELSRHNLDLENVIEKSAISLAYDFNVPLIATNNVSFQKPEDFESHDVLICISQSKTIYETDRKTSSPEFYFKSSEEMENIFQDIPEAILNTSVLAQRCAFMLNPVKPYMPQVKINSDKTQTEALKDMAENGLLERLEKLKNVTAIKLSGYTDFEFLRKHYYERLNYELKVIDDMGFCGYFLIVADYVQWAKKNSIPVGPGRGSGAGSIVAWATQITDIDPIRFQLFFERFLNPERVSMPDFDVDFCQARREEVIEYVQTRYGYDSVAQIVTFGKLQAKAVVRDVGRVLGLPYTMVDKISKMIPFHPTNPFTLQQAIDSESILRETIEEDSQIKHLINIALKLEGLYRHASVHAAGVVISDKNLQDLVPLYKDSKSHMPATQFSMKFVESAGLVKFDFLGLKTLTVIQKVLDFLKKRNIFFQATDILLDDEKTFTLLREVNCVGVFQIESAGMRDVLKKLQPDRIEDLIALVALYRPGPMDDIPKYISCKHGLEKIEYLHEKLKPILEETYGVMVYQEQVMQIAQIIGGYTLGQADILRRAMGKKNKEEMLSQKSKFINGAVENHIEQNVAEHLFELMNKFASYGFNKSHSTPYGLLTYQTAFLKANYMIEFFASTMTLDMMNTDKLFIYYRDAKYNGINVIAPDINKSDHEFIIDYATNAIIYSLSAIKGSGEWAVKEIAKERELNGKFISIFDFVERLSNTKIVNKRILEHLIKAGAFDSLHNNRRQLFESVEQILSVKISNEQSFLFEKTYPDLREFSEWDNKEKLQNEFSAIGFYISAHPMEKYAEQLKEWNIPTIAEAVHYQKTKIAAIINNITYKTTKKQTKFCILQISDMSGVKEVTIFSEVLDRVRYLLEIGNVVLLTVNCQNHNEDNVRIIVEDVKKFDDIYSLNNNVHQNNNKYILEDNCVDVVKKKNNAKIQKKIIKITILNSEQLKNIKQLIDNLRSNGFAEICLIIDNKIVKINGTFLISSYDILDFKKVVGVLNVSENIIKDATL